MKVSQRTYSKATHVINHLTSISQLSVAPDDGLIFLNRNFNHDDVEVVYFLSMYSIELALVCIVMY